MALQDALDSVRLPLLFNPVEPYISIYTKNFSGLVQVYASLYKLKSWESDWAKKLGLIFDKFCANLWLSATFGFELVNFLATCQLFTTC